MQVVISIFTDDTAQHTGYGLKVDVVDSVFRKRGLTPGLVIETGVTVALSIFLSDLFENLNACYGAPFDSGDDFDTSVSKTSHYFIDRLYEAIQLYHKSETSAPSLTPEPGDTDWEDLFRRLANKGGKGKECG